MLNDVCPKSPPLGGTIIMKWKALHSMEHRQRIEAKASPCPRQRIFPRGGRGGGAVPKGRITGLQPVQKALQCSSFGRKQTTFCCFFT
ncbi:hypothetical protein CDAR_53111 [Caerostris darwini]|uniref:Uncharacterized protein n=1 Tax=Caerostris darwini TaxID=1538125 RepID=A0AAV4QU76_9ARAC|nr:hypothetical protein CDAR_53111 [Caerostris darwini]